LGKPIALNPFMLHQDIHALRFYCEELVIQECTTMWGLGLFFFLFINTSSFLFLFWHRQFIIQARAVYWKTESEGKKRIQRLVLVELEQSLLLDSQQEVVVLKKD
jgi:hypothetical protein